MSKKRGELRILYVQIRDDAPTRAEELGEFSRFGRLDEKQFTVINVFDTPEFSPSAIDGHDALFVGGSSDASGLSSVLNPEKYPYAHNLRTLLQHCIEKSIPVFASCYGFEEVVTVLNGELVSDESNVGAGFAGIELADAAKSDPLFYDAPASFPAVSWHSERAQTIPGDNIVILARTPACPYAAIRIAGKPFYGFQFHPEIDRQGLINRLERYISRYQSENVLETLGRIKQTCPDVPFANGLVGKFIDRIVLGQAG